MPPGKSNWNSTAARGFEPEMAISPWHHRTRDTRWLAKTGIGIVLALAALAFVTDLLRSKPAVNEPYFQQLLERMIRECLPDQDPGHDLRQLLEVLTIGSEDADAIAHFITRLVRHPIIGQAGHERGLPGVVAGGLITALLEGTLDERHKAVLDLYGTGLELPSHTILDSDPVTTLRHLAREDPVAAIFAIDLAQPAHPTQALAWAREDGRRFDSDPLRRITWQLAIRQGHAGVVRELFNDPAHVAALTPRLEHQAVKASGDFLRQLRWLWAGWGGYAAPASLFMALFAGLIWFILTLTLDQVPRRRAAWFLIPVLLGALSTLLVLVAGSWQDARIGWGPSRDLFDNALFFTAGVALREELAKLLAAAPVLYWLARVRRSDDITALVAAGCVGLGFAIEENLGYFGAVPDGTVVARFLTANFLHIATTGLSGLALFHLFRHGWRRWEGLLGALLFVILIHGGYNTALASTDFQDESLMAFSIILLGVLSWRFYGTAAPLIPPGRRQISPMAVFVVGLALLIGVTYNVFLWNLDFWDATPDFGLAAIHFAPIGFLFIHHYRDT